MHCLLDRTRRRGRPLAVAALGAVLWAGALTGCKSQEQSPLPPGPTARAPGSGESIAQLLRPLAAALDAAGQTVYVTAVDSDGQGLLLRGAASPGALSPVSTGVALSHPVGLALSSDDAVLIIADAGDAGAAGAAGAVYRGSPGGGFTPLEAGSGSLRTPTAVAVSRDDRSVYVAGIDRSDEQPALWKVSIDGGTFAVVFKGPPLSNPAAVAVADDGSVYVADATAQGVREGGVFRMQEGRAILLATTAPLAMGFPAGLSPAGRGSVELLLTTREPSGAVFLYLLSPDGTRTPVSTAGVAATDAATIYRAAKADVWVAVDAALDVQADPDAPKGQILRLAP